VEEYSVPYFTAPFSSNKFRVNHAALLKSIIVNINSSNNGVINENINVIIHGHYLPKTNIKSKILT